MERKMAQANAIWENSSGLLEQTLELSCGKSDILADRPSTNFLLQAAQGEAAQAPNAPRLWNVDRSARTPKSWHVRLPRRSE
jgi:hypothetical protein